MKIPTYEDLTAASEPTVASVVDLVVAKLRLSPDRTVRERCPSEEVATVVDAKFRTAGWCSWSYQDPVTGSNKLVWEVAVRKMDTQ